MKRIFLATLILGFLHPASGQNTKGSPKLSGLTKLDLGLQGIGLSYEPVISNLLTIEISAGAGGGYDIAEGSINYNIEFFKPAYYFSLTPKYFYNRGKRVEKGKTTLINSGNYIGLKLKYVTPNDWQTDLTRNSILLNVHWGIQRAIGNRWTFTSYIGAGYAQDIDYDFGTIYPAIDFKFSYVLSNLTK